ncbi:hypothetical protein PCYB_051160 [Plasmodium cynomolgi strain B]|uniref:Sporozoite invasion-associated protein 2 n=1 Tax=Plasmodium cynomolgi (strain B) TaxID=1120755 RepID=K6UIL3_PLACD|nr:hypothetical protein PCYB_051160 [Plasmodium cynomolgi strain B]GAB65098.1 hypothetical protein PCYB_051160 [Plasmodium cynomolgi strain B]
MEARRKYYYHYNSLISIGTLLFFTSTFMLCSSSQLEPALDPDSPSSPVHLRLHDYAPSREDMFGPKASQIMTSLYEIIDEDVITTGGYRNESDDDQSNQSTSSDDDIMQSYLSEETDSFDELMDEINSHKKKKKISCPLRKNILKRSDSSDSLSDYEIDDEVLEQTDYEQPQEEEDDDDINLFSDESFEMIDYPWKDILTSSPYDANLTNEDGPYSLEELVLDDPEQKMRFGNIKFFGIEDSDVSEKKKGIAPTTTKSNLEKNSNNSEASNINEHEQEKMEKRKRRTPRRYKNPIEGFSVTTSYDTFLKENGLRDHHPSKHQKDSGEPFVLDKYNYRDVKFKNVKHYVLKILYENVKGLHQKDYQYLTKNKHEVEAFISNILRTNFICLTFSQEDKLFDDAHTLIDKAYIKNQRFVPPTNLKL